MNRKGFTLIELLVVVLIIAVLAAIALPQYQKAVEQARIARILPMLYSLLQAQESHYLTHGDYSYTFADLDIGIPTPNRVTGIGYRDGNIYDGQQAVYNDYTLHVLTNGKSVGYYGKHVQVYMCTARASCACPSSRRWAYIKTELGKNVILARGGEHINGRNSSYYCLP